MIDTIQQLKESNERMQKSIDAADKLLTGKNYIVMVGMFAITPVIEDGQTTGEIKMGTPDEVARFTRRDAEILAQNCTNGNGELAKAVHWIDECEDRIARNNELIENMERYLEGGIIE